MQCQFSLNGAEGTTDEACDMVLTSCTVEAVPERLTVRLIFDLESLMEKAPAVALGLSYENAVEIHIENSKACWAAQEENVLVFAPESVVSQQEGLHLRPSQAGCEGEQASYLRPPTYALATLIPTLVKASLAEQVQAGAAGAALGNVFLNTLLEVGNKLAGAVEWCCICLLKHQVPSGRLRPCTNDLCLYKFEELGLGTAVVSEVMASPDLVELELAMAAAAANSPRAEQVFEPFPSFLLISDEQTRGRAGFFTQLQKCREQEQLLCGQLQQQAPASRSSGGGACNKKLIDLQEALESIPAVEDLGRCRREPELCGLLEKGWFTRPTVQMLQRRARVLAEAKAKKEGRSLPVEVEQVEEAMKKDGKEKIPYKLLRFVLSSNRLALELLKAEEELPVAGTVAQFVVLSECTEREARFEEKRGEKGSFFAFHGSRAENWYSILRNGLRSLSNTRYMTTGAAFGAGIYLAKDRGTSMSYSQSGAGWHRGTYKKGFKAMAICEVINGSLRAQNDRADGYGCDSIMVVLPENEEDVLIRYLLISEPDYDGGIEKITGNLLLNNGTTQDLSQHLKQRWAAGQFEKQKRRLELRKVRLARQKQQQAAAEAEAKAAAAAAVGVGRGVTVRGRKRAYEEQGSNSATQAIQKELRQLMKLHLGKLGVQSSSLPPGSFTVELPDGEGNLYKWRIALLPAVFKGSPLAQDLAARAKQRGLAEIPVLLELRFPSDFPWKPPFVRVVSPRFAFHTGHVTIGGSICMELLTESGWSPAYALESVLVQIVSELMGGGARLDQSVRSESEYFEGEALEAFTRVAQQHGWKIGKVVLQ